jgi:hypothetical protein
MSWKMSAKAKDVLCGVDGEEITTTEKLVLLVLADYHNEEDGYAWPSVATLAKKCLSSDRTIQNSLKHLQACGLLVIQEIRGQKSRYFLLGETPENTAPVQPVVEEPPQPRVNSVSVSIIEPQGESAAKEQEEDSGEVFKQIKRYYRRKTGRPIGNPGYHFEAFDAAVQRYTGDVVLGAAQLWTDELERSFARTIRWPFSMFMKKLEEKIEAYYDQNESLKRPKDTDIPYEGAKFL